MTCSRERCPLFLILRNMVVGEFSPRCREIEAEDRRDARQRRVDAYCSHSTVQSYMLSPDRVLAVKSSRDTIMKADDPASAGLENVSFGCARRYTISPGCVAAVT